MFLIIATILFGIVIISFSLFFLIQGIKDIKEIKDL